MTIIPCQQRELYEKDLKEYPLESYSFTYKGFNCIIRRGPLQCWNGYVDLQSYLVSKMYTSDLLEIDSILSEEEIDRLRVHGGMTFTHKNIYGFDTSHFTDWTPSSLFSHATYKTYDFVYRETISLAMQLYVRCIFIKECVKKWKSFPALSKKHRQEEKENKTIYECCVHEIKMKLRDTKKSLV